MKDENLNYEKMKDEPDEYSEDESDIKTLKFDHDDFMAQQLAHARDTPMFR